MLDIQANTEFQTVSRSIINVLEGLVNPLEITPSSNKISDIKDQMISLVVKHLKKSSNELEVYTDSRSNELLVLDKGVSLKTEPDSQVYAIYSIKDNLITILPE